MLETETFQNHWVELGSLAIAIVGIGFLIIQLLDVRRAIGLQNGQLHIQNQQLDIQNEQLKAQALGTLYGHYFDYCRALLEKPYLRAFLYGDIRASVDPVENNVRAEVETLCELLTGIFEQAEVQRRNLPGDTGKIAGSH
jgi:hypothetical protein